MEGDRPSVEGEVSAPGFVGRERELAALGDALARPSAVVLVAAEPGAGKSRLVQELLGSPAGGLHRMLVAVCPPFLEALTLGPIVDAIRQVRECPAGLALGPSAGALRPLLPEWAPYLPPAPEARADQPAQRLLFQGIADVFSALGVTGLVLEDAHWADPVTIELLLFLAGEGRIRLVVTYRPAELPAPSPLRRFPNATAIALEPLDPAETARMISSMLDGGRVSEELARFLHQRTGGLPLAVEESVRLLRDQADLLHSNGGVGRGGGWGVRRPVAELQVSPALRDSVLERVRRLSPAAQRVLEATAVLAEPVDPHVVAAVAGAAVPDAIAEAVGSGLLRRTDQPAFRHPFMAQVVYEAIPGAERRRLHRLAGLTRERRPDTNAVSLCRHFREAHEVDRWARYAELAADQAVAAGSQTTAAQLLIELLAGAPLPATDRLRLAGRLAASTLVRRDPIDELHRRVVRTVRAVLADHPGGGDSAELRSQLGRLLAQQGNLTAARTELERAALDLPAGSVQAARAMTYLGWPWLGPGSVSSHQRWLRRAAAVDQRAFSTADRLALTVDRAAALLQLGDPAGWTLAAELPTSSEGPDDSAEIRRLLARAHLNLGYGAILWGRYGEARDRLAATAAMVDIDHYPRLGFQLQAAEAELAWLTGDWRGLDQAATELLAAEAAEPLVRVAAVRLAGRLHAVAGAVARAEECFDRALRDAGQLGAAWETLDTAAELGRLWLTEGRPEEALAITEEPIQPVTAKRIWVWATGIAPVRVEALLAIGRRAEAEALVSGYARGLRSVPAPGPRAALATCRALLAGARDPAGHAEAAVAWERLPRPYEALLAREREALCRLPTDQEPALAQLGTVWRALSGLRAHRDAERIRRRLRERGVDLRRPWRGGRRGYGTQPSPRELEVIRLVLAGQTNREIAVALQKSPRTVAGQLASVMRKLGVSSRTELAVRAVEAGLVHEAG
jgi:DNA-binding CsgD family transcriptional regulator/tetratricopeptide (TPR) repeat protein